MFNILYLNINLFEDDILVDKAMALISAERREKTKKLKNPVPAKLSLGAGVLLRIALEQAGHGDYLDQIKYGMHGKPFFEGIPFHFSLSHSGEYAICVYGDTPVGIDLQKIKRDIPVHTKKILSPVEATYLNQLQKPEDFYKLWSRKESLIKWDGRGLKLVLNELSFIKNNEWVNEIQFEDNTLFIHDFNSLIPEYTCSICSDKPVKIGDIIEIDTKILTNY